MPNVLFICGKARKRSPTAAQIAPGLLGCKADCAGLSADADERLSAEHIAWADVIAVMEKTQMSRLKRQFGALVGGKRVVCLDVRDEYEFMQPELVALLRQRFSRLGAE